MHHQRTWASLWMVLTAFVMLVSCSSAEKQSQQRSQAWIDRIALATLHYRRPVGEGADPAAGPGGVDYQSQPLPNSRLDCEPSEKLFSGIDLRALRACLVGAKSNDQDFILTYGVQKTNPPKLVLRKQELSKDEIEKGKKARPACIDSLIGELAVPREIYFQGLRDTQRNELGCYAAGLTLDTPPLMGFRLRAENSEVVIRTASIRNLSSDSDLQKLLLTWVLAPYWNTERHQILAKVVPDRLCRVCIGDQNLVRVQSPPVPLWPAEGEEAEATQTVQGSGTDVEVGTPNLPEQTGIN